MGTNYYLFTKNKEMALKYAPYTYKLVDEPDFGYKIHIGKTSMGWLPLFQAHEKGISSVKEYKEAYDTGEFKIYDECDDEYNWEEFDERVLQHNGGKRGIAPLVKRKKPSKTEPFYYLYDENMPEYGPVSHIAGTKQSYHYERSCWDEVNTIYEDDEGYEFEEKGFS